MEVVHTGLRHYRVSAVYYTALILSAVAIFAALMRPVPDVAAMALLGVSVLLKIWIQWQNDRGGFGGPRRHYSRYSVGETLSPSRWLFLLILILIESVLLIFVVLAPTL